MPWHIEKRDNEFCVILDSDNSVVKCHETSGEAIDHLAALYANEPEAARSFSDETVIAFGSGVKTLDGGRIGGYLVRFSDETSPDLEGDFFTAATDFDIAPGAKSAVYLNHKLPLNTRNGGAIVVKEKIGEATLDIDSVGVLIDAVLFNRAEYDEMLTALGWSSGTAAHLVETETKGAANWIKTWPLGLDASLTPTPAEPRNSVISLKSWLGQDGLETRQEGGQDDPPPIVTAEKPEPDSVTVTMTDVEVKYEDRSNTMSDTNVVMTLEEVKALLTKEQEPDKPEDGMKLLGEKLDAILDAIKASPKLKDAGYVAPDSETDHAEAKSFGDFMIAVRRGNKTRIKEVYKTAMAEDAGATGGYLVPTAYASAIIAAAEPFSVLRRAGATVLPVGKADSIEVPALDIETAPSAGDTAYAGGVIAYWTEEAAAMTESEPSFRMIRLQPHKLSGYSLASNELRQDSPESLDALLTTLFGRAVGSKENYAFFRGDGVGKPRGILESGALTSVARSAASAVALADVAGMMAKLLPGSWGRGAWFINPGVLAKLIQLVSSPVSWMENARQGIPVTLLGLPLYVTGALPALNTAGDILLVDPSYYLIADKPGGMTVAYSEHYKFVNDQATWRFTHRVDGEPWVDAAITLEDASTTVTPYVALAAGS